MSVCDDCPIRKALDGYLTEHLLGLVRVEEKVAHLHDDFVRLRDSIEKHMPTVVRTYPETVTQ